MFERQREAARSEGARKWIGNGQAGASCIAYRAPSWGSGLIFSNVSVDFQFHRFLSSGPLCPPLSHIVRFAIKEPRPVYPHPPGYFLHKTCVMDSAVTESGPLTVDSVGKMTTYELRQEAEKRGLLEDMSNVNHATLLQRLVQASTHTSLIDILRDCTTH